MSDFFKLLKISSKSKARIGIVKTSHGEIQTPIFMPVGTQGTVKSLSPADLKLINAQIILGNTYHLYLRPGNDVLQHFGGLHKFMNWSLPILTDSGGFQVFSLNELRRLTDNGAEFKSHIDGSKHLFTPENVVETQRIIGSDIMMVLDECVSYPTTYEYAKQSCELSLNWAKRSRQHFIKLNNEKGNEYGHKQFQFGIGQGSMFKELRSDYIKQMIEIEFDGYAIGGLSVGEPIDIMYDMVKHCTDIMPINSPRYLMGVGTPENILQCIELGIDMFDCVMPTRNARNGQIFTTTGKKNIRNAKFQFSNTPIDENLNNWASNNFSLGYLRHLTICEEVLGLKLASMQNLAFYLWLVEQARIHILNDDYEKWKSDFLFHYNNNN